MSSGAWSAVFAGIDIVVAGIAVFVAVRAAKGQNEAARQQLRAAAWNMIARFDETLREYGGERQWVKEQAPNQLEDQKTDSGKLDIVGYMGAFERLNELLETAPDIVSEKTAHAFYGPRLRVLLKRPRPENSSIAAQRAGCCSSSWH